MSEAELLGTTVGHIRIVDLLGQDLDRDFAVQPWVAGAVDLAHASSSQRSQDLVGAEACSG